MYIHVQQELPFALQAMLAGMYVFTDYAGLLKFGVFSSVCMCGLYMYIVLLSGKQQPASIYSLNKLLFLEKEIFFCMWTLYRVLRGLSALYACMNQCKHTMHTLTVTMLGCCALRRVLISRKDVIGKPSFSLSIFSFFNATISPGHTNKSAILIIL